MPQSALPASAGLGHRLAQAVRPGDDAALRALAARYATAGFDAAPSTHDVDTLRAVLCAHLTLGRRRAPGTPAVQVRLVHTERRHAFTVLDVVTDDMPFLVDSLGMALTRAGSAPLAIAHPVLRARRSRTGTLVALDGNGDAGAPEAWMHFELPALTESARQALADTTGQVLAQVRAAVTDWADMRAHLLGVADTVARTPQPVTPDDRDESVAFLRWLADDHFTFIAASDYALRARPDYDLLRPLPGTGRGLLRPGPAALETRVDTRIPAALRSHTYANALLVLTKSSASSPLHRPAQLDYVGIRRFDARGRLRGEWRFLGLYASSVYHTRPFDVPLLRRKVARVLETADLPAGGHSAKALVHLLETFPREEMLQANADELSAMALGLLAVHDQHRLRLFMRREVFGRFATALLYVPRDRYRTELRETALRVLMEALDGVGSEFSTQFSESAQVRVYFVVRIRPGATPQYDVAALEQAITAAMHTWEDRFLVLAEEGVDLPEAPRWRGAFPANYQVDCTPAQALADLGALLARPPGTALALDLADHPGGYRLRVRGDGEPLALSDALPPLEHFGLRVLAARPYELRTPAGGAAFVLDFELTCAHAPPAQEVRARFEQALARVLDGTAEDDGLNRLVLGAGLDWREVMLVRAIVKHLLQLQIPFSQPYMEQCLARHGALVHSLVQAHHLRFDPAVRRRAAATQAPLDTQIAQALDAIVSLDEDRILRRVHEHIGAMVRTSYFQSGANGQPRARLAYKIDPHGLTDMPEPRPYREIFVYATDVEGVHLRGGPVARGGIRHSDRREDFRTEVLGLMKAQMVKNAVIVPVGAKGGFVVKRPLPAERAARDTAVRAAYSTFIRSLLDLTDNRVGARVVAPPEVVRHDGDDPYLVVAADKGTAAFSDLANTIAADYGYWLDDAFASGGSNGYDHKEMGITARGAWESVKRHFREIGLDYQRAPFTVVGIGDMSGDVFGNGLLQSEKIRLVAAFDHRHIFLDPDPDPGASFAERKRLFALARSSWVDYDAALISPGGGVYPRTAKSIELTAPVRATLDTQAESLTPAELIQVILRAPVDLLWNGGIGTYVKATHESHLAVGDRGNDAVRVNGAELRCKVVGEGGNLGFTQLGRIEYARAGGCINTDAIDNSAGVDASDHEVNLKILLADRERQGRMTRPARNRLLRAMTESVASSVLADNHGQALVLAVESAQGAYLLSEHARLLRGLERLGRVHRALEHLPDDAQLDALASAGAGLTRPELAVLLAHAKIDLFGELRGSELLADAELAPLLGQYFPARLRRAHGAAFSRHPLACEILATFISNQIINRMGPTFVARVRDETGADALTIVRAATLAARLYDLPALWTEIDALDDTVPGAVQIDVLVDVRRLLERATAWLVRRPEEVAAAHRAGPPLVRSLADALTDLLAAPQRRALDQRVRTLRAAGATDTLAAAAARLDTLYCALDIGALARWRITHARQVGADYFALADQLEVPWLHGAIRALPRLHHFQRKARSALREELYAQIARLTAQVLRTRAPGSHAPLHAWRERIGAALEHYGAVVAEVRAGKGVDLAGLTVAIGELRALGRE